MNTALPSIIVDSAMSRDAILAQNPDSPAPQSALDVLEVLNVTYVGFDDALHTGQIAVHKDVLQDVKRFFDAAREMKFPIEKVIPISNEKYAWNDERSCDDNNSSGYNYRLIAGTDRVSKHAAGLAFDINPVQNIFVKYDTDLSETFRFPKDAVYDEQASGTLTKVHPLVQLMKSLGWEWGGDWTPESGRIDYQHFEKS
ncbi:MAG: M15 family metallopeptidase [Candidatus Paceibacterota bacterium]|jgi:hypothetical protein